MKAIIIGMGVSGKCAMHALNDLGYELAVQDSKTPEKADPVVREFCKNNHITEYYGAMPEDFSDFDMMILSPGVDPEKDFVRKAAEQNVEIVGELELAYRLAKGTFVGITGTNGKTTTTTLIGEIFKASGKKTNVVGNIGLPVISVCLNSGPDDWMVTEVSSFQLQTVKEFRPKVCLMLNLSPDHLDRHHTMEEYGRTKAAIWKNQGPEDYLIMNLDDPVLMKLCLEDIEKKPEAKIAGFSRKTEVEFGAFLMGDDLVIRDEEGRIHKLLNKNELKVPGGHNIENALGAAAVSFFCGIEPETIAEVLREFRGVEHRLEFVTEKNNVKIYNDSKGTNTDASLVAISALGENIILIAGGDAKNQDFTYMAEQLGGPVKHVLLFGRDSILIKEAMDKAGYRAYTDCTDLKDCVSKAWEMAVPGDSILFSPACASWDMYPNFEVRGRHFKECVTELVK